MGSRITLTVACDDFDHIRALMEGSVKREGIDPVFITELTNPERHGKMARELAFDVCELNLPTYLIARHSGVPITALPIFLFRKFRHGKVYVNSQSGITRPEDLIGKQIGPPRFSQRATSGSTASCRSGMASRIVSKPGWSSARKMHGSRRRHGSRSSGCRGAKPRFRCCSNGELPALMTPQTPKAILDGDKRIARLFPNYVERERTYFQETGIFPIMHVTAIKQEIVERYPWVPMMLCRAFEAAKQLAYQRMANVRVVPLPWFAAHWEDERRLFGPDPWAYGLGETNRKTIETAVRYTHE